MPRAGILRHRLHVQGEAQVDDGQGGIASAAWTTTATIWGSLEGLSGQEQIEGGQVNARALYRIRTRWRADIGPTHRIMHADDGRVFNVLSAVDPTGRKKELELLVEQQP